ncbi:hypothetical protein ACFV4P_21725 [Kitasatospora sp. NPDC059795]|uniref:hypothetical protein n=1 Tax=Kitasatospora sp. NPDC059795 TaxID=3346949 RepID=UPI00364C6EB2
MSRTTSARLLAACATTALAAGLFTAPAAQAVPGHAVTGPSVRATPALAGDGCWATGTPGWVTTADPVLTAHTTAPSARFKVWDATGTKVFDGAADTAADGTVQVTVTGLADGPGYTWQVWPEYAPGSGAPTETCRFGVDTAAPTGLTVTSTDFPENGGGKFAGQPGVFTFSATDAGSGVACFRYALDNVIGVGGCTPGPDVVAAAADGTASVTIKPDEWGTHHLSVQALDHTGRVAQTVYTFLAPWNPNPPKALGDVDNDGVPDILLPDSNGNLLVISGNAGSTTPTTVVPAARAPWGGSWSGLQITHKGWSGGGASADTIYVRDASPGNSGLLYQYVNRGGLPLGTRSPSLTYHATDCVDTAMQPVACPAGHSTDFSAVQQLVAFGSVNPASPVGITLLDVEQGDLWLQHDPSRFGDSGRLTTTGLWNGYDLIAPGPDANGNLVLWSREQATGTLRAHAVPKLADGSFDFSGLANPADGTVIGSFPVADYPTLGSSGDLDGDGQADLYAVTAGRHLITFKGVVNPKDLGPLA